MIFSTRTFRYIRDLYDARHEPENTRVLADLFWRVILVTTAFCIVAIIAFGSWQFITVLERLASAQRPEGTPPAALDRSELQAALTAFAQRETAYAELIARPVSVSDPSR